MFTNINNQNNNNNKEDEILGSLFGDDDDDDDDAAPHQQKPNKNNQQQQQQITSSVQHNNTMDNTLYALFNQQQQHAAPLFNAPPSSNGAQTNTNNKPSILFQQSNFLSQDGENDLFGDQQQQNGGDDDEDDEYEKMFNMNDDENNNNNNNNTTSSSNFSSMADALLAFVEPTTSNNQQRQQQQQKQQQQLLSEDASNNNEDNQQQQNFHVDKAYLRLQAKEQQRSHPGGSQKTLPPFDPSEIDYASEPAIEKNFYIPPTDITKLTEAEVEELRKSLDGARIVHGENPPRPMRSFETCGLNDATVEVLRKRNFLEPFAVQSMAVPVLMSGRDLVLTAKTGSGKTLAYLLPLLRHVKNQKIVLRSNGYTERDTITALPRGLVLVPTTELADQVFKVLKEFAEANTLRVLRCYSATEIKNNFHDITRGHCDIIVATPGRLFDICSRNKMRHFLSRVSFVVLDEADRLFDEGLGKAVRDLLQRVRPDHQFALVSSTMPKEVKQLFKPLLETAIEISVGGRQNPSSNVTQSVEFFELKKNEDDGSVVTALEHDPRYRRLLQLLGDHYSKNPKAQVIVFVQSKETCDNLYFRLVNSGGYGGLIGTLSSGLDNEDRISAMLKFASAEKPILIATAVAERGLDINDLDLVINYDVPDHFEAYVNRIGRTGRAGKRGAAITFFVRDVDDELAKMLLHALEGSNQAVPDDLKMISEQFDMKVKEGIIKPKHRNFATGYMRSKGFSFAKHELQKSASLLEEQQKSFEEDTDDANNNKTTKDGDKKNAEDDFDMFWGGEGNNRRAHDPEIRIVNQSSSDKLTIGGGGNQQQQPQNIRSLLRQMNARRLAEEAGTITSMRVADFPLNDYGPRVRRVLQLQKVLVEIGEATDCSLTAKGRHMTAVEQRLIGNSDFGATKPLYLEIRGPTEQAVTRAFRRLDAKIEEESLKEENSRSAGLYNRK